MTAPNEVDALLLERAELDPGRVAAIVSEALRGADDGELFVEHRQSESLVFDDGRLRNASFDSTQGFGLRAVCGETVGFSHASELSEAAMRRAAETVRTVARGYGGTLAAAPQPTNRRLYSDASPLVGIPFERKVALLEAIDTYARGRDARVVQVSASLLASWQLVRVFRGDGSGSADIRPLVRLNVSVIVEQDGRRETGSHGGGGRVLLDRYLEEAQWKTQVDEALRQALINLESVPAPAGEMEVVLGPGWPGVLLHEAVGHGLEGDFNRKGTSAFAGLLGERVAAPGVTVIDEGDLPDRRGSLTVDDEGTPSQTTTLIEDGRLVGYMQDRMNARLMGVAPTGNGRRQDFASLPMPRMTNTFMLAGDRSPEEIIASVDRGLYAVNFGGGQVDITNGKFVFSASEAYLIENGRVTAPVKGATLIGNGPEALKRISMIGDDMALDGGIGTCGKQGQSVPVGVGQPTLRIAGLTVGGTAV